MKKVKPIYHLKDGERQMCKTLYKTGTMHVKDARSHFEVSDRRFKQMIKEGFVKKEGNLLRLNKKGQDYLEKKMGLSNPYRSKPSQWRHDLVLNKIYLSRTQSERESWKSETKTKYEIMKDPVLKERYLELQKSGWKSSWTDYGRKNFIPDGVYYSESEGCYVAVEITTSHYSLQDIEQKLAFVQEFYSGKFHGGSIIKA